jgi:ElaB/YqjD/DUF883 family membrane-anchored ribosome-binding protein
VTSNKNDHPSEPADASGMAAAALSAAAKRATQALGSARGAVAGADLDEMGSKAVAAATTLYRQGRDILSNSEELTQAKEELSGAIRKNPLAAVGIAFAVGIVIALITRG